MHKPISIIAFPGGGDSYTDCFYTAMREFGCVVKPGVYSGRWLLKNFKKGEFVHLNWPSFLYRNERPCRSVSGIARFMFLLLLATVRGVKIIWTAHNLYPHDHNSIPWSDWIIRKIVIRFSKRVFVHGPSAAKILSDEFSESIPKIVQITHGNWIHYYPNDVGKAEARRNLTLPGTSFTFLFIGVCKEYKNLEGLLHAFQAEVPESCLVIAGRFQRTDYQRNIECLIQKNPANIFLFPVYISDDRLQIFFASADVVVLPYLEVLTSGSVMLAMSFGKPVVAPRRGHLVDVVPDFAGILYDPTDQDGLRNAMLEAKKRSFDGAAILAHARSFEWSDSARTVVKELQEIVDASTAHAN